jgi:hypothetical protein
MSATPKGTTPMKTDTDAELSRFRVTLADIEEAIESEHYFTAADGVNGKFIGYPE